MVTARWYGSQSSPARVLITRVCASWNVVRQPEVKIKLSELTEKLEQVSISGNADVEIEGIDYDSRLMKPNGLFIAVKGYKQDGYDYVRQAREGGAVAVMGERQSCPDIETHITVPDARRAMAAVAARFYGYPGRKLNACGVTGTNGKTTTCYLIKSILDSGNEATGMITTQIYDTGKQSYPAERTTPESLDVQRFLSQMLEHGCSNAVIEVSSHALILNRVDDIDFKVGVYTNLTRDHLDFHKTMEEYLRAKTMLADRIEGENSCVVVNLDVPEFKALMDRGGKSYISYSVSDNTANVYCRDFDIKPHGTVFNLVTPKGEARVNYRLPGRFNLVNAMAAAAGGTAIGADLDSIVHGLESAQPVPGRFNYVGVGQPFAIYVDYAHTPDAIERLCESAREISDRRLLILFGCGGDRDRGKRPLMGQAAIVNADFAFVTSDNPRSEDPMAIIEDIKPGLTGENFRICPDRTEAIEQILQMAEPGDVVLLAGKGDENYQEINGVREHFSDTEEAINVLARMGYTRSDTKREN